MSEKALCTDERLLKYVQHLPGCAALPSDGPFAPYPCSCGLDEIRDPDFATKKAEHAANVRKELERRGIRL